MASLTDAACPPSPRRRARKARNGSRVGTGSRNRLDSDLPRTFSNMTDPFALSASSESDDRSSSDDEGGEGIAQSLSSAVVITRNTAIIGTTTEKSSHRQPSPGLKAGGAHARSFRDFAPKSLPLSVSSPLSAGAGNTVAAAASAGGSRVVGRDNLVTSNSAFQNIFGDLDSCSDPPSNVLEHLCSRCNSLVASLARPVGYYDSGFEQDFANIISASAIVAPVYVDQSLETRRRNRYANVLPLASSNVELCPENKASWSVDSAVGGVAHGQDKMSLSRPRGATVEQTSTYINANFVAGDTTKRNGHDKEGINGGVSATQYIAAQAPKAAYLDEWWMMIWDQNVPVIVMLTKCTEGKKRKADPYWPSESSSSCSSSSMSVSSSSFPNYENPEYSENNLTESMGGAISVVQHGPIQLSLRSSTTTKGIVERKIQMIRINSSNGTVSEPRIVTQLHFLEWPDFGVPADVAMLDPLLESMRKYRQESDLMGPTVVHCSAGIGRTGTILAIVMTVQKLRAALSGTDFDCCEKPWWVSLGCKHHPLDIYTLVLDLRLQRHGSVINYVSVFEKRKSIHGRSCS